MQLLSGIFQNKCSPVLSEWFSTTDYFSGYFTIFPQTAPMHQTNPKYNQTPAGNPQLQCCKYKLLWNELTSSHSHKTHTRYILPPLSKYRPNVLKPTLTNKTELTITQMYTHFTQLYIGGNFSTLTDVVRISGREWVPTRPSHHLNLFSIKPIIHNVS